MAVTSMNRREFLLGATVASVAVPAALSAQHPVQGMARSRFALTVLNPDCMVEYAARPREDGRAQKLRRMAYGMCKT